MNNQCDVYKLQILIFIETIIITVFHLTFAPQ